MYYVPLLYSFFWQIRLGWDEKVNVAPLGHKPQKEYTEYWLFSSPIQTGGADIKGAGKEGSLPPVAFLSKSGLSSSLGWSYLPDTHTQENTWKCQHAHTQVATKAFTYSQKEEENHSIISIAKENGLSVNSKIAVKQTGLEIQMI